MTTPHHQADLLRAIADGKQMQELDFTGINHPGNWCDCDADRALNRISRGVEQYVRIKPETVTINSIECPAPMRVAPAAQPPAGWPRASISDSCLGWILDYKFLDKVESIARIRTGYSTSMEATEQVLIAALEVLATAPEAAPASQDAEDAARLDWLTFNLSGAALRAIGVEWPERGDARKAIDAARAKQEGK